MIQIFLNTRALKTKHNFQDKFVILTRKYFASIFFPAGLHRLFLFTARMDTDRSLIIPLTLSCFTRHSHSCMLSNVSLDVSCYHNVVFSSCLLQQNKRKLIIGNCIENWNLVSGRLFILQSNLIICLVNCM